MKCACKDENCKTEIKIGNGNELWFTDKNGKETLMYLDANLIVFLIVSLRDNLIKLTNKEA